MVNDNKALLTRLLVIILALTILIGFIPTYNIASPTVEIANKKQDIVVITGTEIIEVEGNEKVDEPETK